MTAVLGWRVGMLVREAFKNVFTLRSRLFAVILLAALLGSSAAAFAALESRGLDTQLLSIEDRGSSVVTFRSREPDQPISVTRSSCEALARRDGVVRAGALVDIGVRDIRELGARIRVYSGSSTLFPQLARHDGVLGAALQRSAARRNVTLGQGDVRQLAPGANQPEGVPTNGAVVLPLSPLDRTVPSCIAVLDRFTDVHGLASVLAAELSVSGGDVAAVRQLVPTSDPAREWCDRPGQFAWLAVGFVVGVVVSLLTWTRSSEIAAYRLSGTSRIQLVVLIGFEVAIVAAVFMVSAVASLCVVTDGSRPDTANLLWSIAGAASLIVVSSVGTMRSVLVSAARLTRE